MAQLTVRNIDVALVEALKDRAAKAGRSAEAEHRKILEDALRPGRNQDFFALAQSKRVKLTSGSLTTTEMLRQEREAPK
ncbi:FitA-like ribbon-helix-helix domain-containing protein [Loktanella sp. DJP18]|uniref:FitA-like ribbon-helix-helix domain-containing protein n=1 Tax=Loktanella sp. DJP18 TaxID=3409788 RepID=UPI003BB62CEF